MTINFGSNVIAQTVTVHRVFNHCKYKLPNFQREFMWGRSQVLEMLSDLTECFLAEYKSVQGPISGADNSIYFLGNIITLEKGAHRYVIDGHQRLTTLTLLLILIRNLQNEQNLKYKIDIDNLIFSVMYGRKSFNLDIEERESCMRALYDNEDFELSGQSTSVVNMYNRYKDLQENWPVELSNDVLLDFIDWLLKKVYLVEICVGSYAAAYAMFETMNNRGISNRSSDLLKGYLLSHITDEKQNAIAAKVWEEVISNLKSIKREADLEFIKAWLRSKYSQCRYMDEKKILLQDFDRIGSDFHRWIIDESENVGLKSGTDFFQFIKRDFRFYSNQYMKIVKAANEKISDLESVHYVSKLGNNFQFMILLSPLKPNDSNEVINGKLQRTSYFIENLLTRRLWNSQSITGLDMQNRMFEIMTDIRDLNLQELVKYFRHCLEGAGQFGDNGWFGLNKRNSRLIRWVLARLTEYVEVGSGLDSRFDEYLRDGPKGYVLEHICTSNRELVKGVNKIHNRIHSWKDSLGGLVLLSKAKNFEINELSFEEKLSYYNNANLLARSLSIDCYNKNPGFVEFVKNSSLPFRPYSVFGFEELEERWQLYCKIAKQIWDPAKLKSLG